MTTTLSPRKVAVGLGGGAASAVAAALLKSEGYDVQGVFFRRGSPGLCRSERAEEKAREIARILDVPIFVEDVSERYEAQVTDAYVHGVLEGRRPIPCAACHSAVILPELERVADQRGCGLFATGHFAGVGRDAATGLGRLYRASETLPDQGFWLYGMPASSLSRLLTPLGGLSIPMIEKLAAQFDLPADPKGVLGNVGVCFAEGPEGLALVENRTPREFRVKGPARTLSGGIAGDHPGLYRFNLGDQFASGNPSKGEPDLFVESFDLARHTLVVGPQESLIRREILGADAHWIRPVSGLKGLKCQARFSPGGEAVPCLVTHFESGRVRVNLEKPVRAPHSGRPLVFFEENEILGGAIIERAY